MVSLHMFKFVDASQADQQTAVVDVCCTKCSNSEVLSLSICFGPVFKSLYTELNIRKEQRVLPWVISESAIHPISCLVAQLIRQVIAVKGRPRFSCKTSSTFISKILKSSVCSELFVIKAILNETFSS